MKDQEDRVLPVRLAQIMATDSPLMSFGRFTVSHGPYAPVEEQLYMPEWMTITTTGYGEPDLMVRIELRKSAPRIVHIEFHAKDDSREIRFSDFRSINLQEYIEVYEHYVSEMEIAIRALVNRGILGSKYNELLSEAINNRDEEAIHSLPGVDYANLQTLVRDSVEHQRRGGKRVINGAFLKQVASVYRENIDHAPTAAVSRTFGVKHRQATDYVKQARDRGLLPPTQQGKAKA